MSDTKSKLGLVMYAVRHRDSPSIISVLPTRGAFDLIRHLPGSPFVGNEFPVHVLTPTELRELVKQAFFAGAKSTNATAWKETSEHFADYLKELGMEGEMTKQQSQAERDAEAHYQELKDGGIDEWDSVAEESSVYGQARHSMLYGARKMLEWAEANALSNSSTFQPHIFIAKLKEYLDGKENA